MWREIEFHLYRVHLLTLRFLGGNGDERISSPPPHSLENAFQCFSFFSFFYHLCFQSLSQKRVHILSSFCDIWGQHAL